MLRQGIKRLICLLMQRAGAVFCGGQIAREVRGFCCVHFGDEVIGNNEFAVFAAVKGRRLRSSLAAMGLSASLAQSDPYPESRPG